MAFAVWMDGWRLTINKILKAWTGYQPSSDITQPAELHDMKCNWIEYNRKRANFAFLLLFPQMIYLFANASSHFSINALPTHHCLFFYRAMCAVDGHTNQIAMPLLWKLFVKFPQFREKHTENAFDSISGQYGFGRCYQFSKGAGYQRETTGQWRRETILNAQHYHGLIIHTQSPAVPLLQNGKWDGFPVSDCDLLWRPILSVTLGSDRSCSLLSSYNAAPPRPGLHFYLLHCPFYGVVQCKTMHILNNWIFFLYAVCSAPFRLSRDTLFFIRVGQDLIFFSSEMS